MFHFLATGALLGLSAGLAPGPLLTLVIAETLKHDVRAGIRVALSPVITDVPIIILTLFILTKLSGFNNLLGAISVAGSSLILYMGFECMKPGGFESTQEVKKPKSLMKGVMANALSPHPYLFWISVGAPTVTKAMTESGTAPFLFIGGFYFLLIGSKVALAVVVGRSKSFMKGAPYLYTMRILGIALMLLALILFRDGMRLFGVI